MPDKKLTVAEAASLMGCDPQFLRIALRQGRFSEFGTPGVNPARRHAVAQ